MLTFGTDHIAFCSAGQRLKIIPWGKNALRVLCAMTAEIPMRDWALLPQGPIIPEITQSDEGLTIRNGEIRCSVDPFGKLTFRNGAGNILLQDYARDNRVSDQTKNSPLMVHNRTFRPHRGGDWEISVRFEADPEEFLCGMGQYQEETINLKGCKLELAQRCTQASVPYVVSSKGYGFLWHNPAIGWVSFANNCTEWHADAADVVDYWICAGDTPAQLVEQYAAVTGTVPMMPEYGLGYWQCRLRYATQEQLLEVAREYHRRGVPLDVIIIDYFHWTRQGEWKFDPKYWPDPAAMVRELEEMGTKLMVSVWPSVEPKSENFAEMRDRDLLVRTERGKLVATECVTDCAVVDSLNPEAREYLWSKIRENYVPHGVKLFWLDTAEPELVDYEFDNYRSSLGPWLKVGNLYPQRYTRAFYEGLQDIGVEAPVNLVRCAWAGSQRYGALAWSGDVNSTFDALRVQVCAGLNMAMAGIPWWTTDIGGFWNGDGSDPVFRELLVRWFQFGCYSPVMRAHGWRLPTLPGPAPNEPGGGQMNVGSPNEIWSFGQELCEIFTHYIQVRNAMRPYLRTLMAQAHETGAPILRPLFYEFPEDPAAWQIKDAYCFGPDLLVAPVMIYGARERQVYLPAGASWTEETTGMTYEGGQTVTAAAPLAVIPVFHRK